MFKTYTLDEFIKDIQVNYGIDIVLGVEHGDMTLFTSLVSELHPTKQINESNVDGFKDIIEDFISNRMIPKNLDKPFQEDYFCAFYGLKEVGDGSGFFIDSLDDDGFMSIPDKHKKEFALGALREAFKSHYNTILCVYNDGGSQLFTRDDPVLLN